MGTDRQKLIALRKGARADIARLEDPGYQETEAEGLMREALGIDPKKVRLENARLVESTAEMMLAREVES
jgi:hypothetical protein